MKAILLLICFLVISGDATAQAPKDSSWDGLRPLLGKWIAEGGGQPGLASAGGFSFDFDLQGKVLVRRNYSEYPATGGKPASRHDDLMVIYQEPDKRMRAVYFDNEGHVIHYSVVLSEDKRAITLLSDPVATAPRFRFIYNLLKDNSLSMEFDIAPPGKPDSFSKYVEGKATRQ